MAYIVTHDDGTSTRSDPPSYFHALKVVHIRPASETALNESSRDLIATKLPSEVRPRCIIAGRCSHLTKARQRYDVRQYRAYSLPPLLLHSLDWQS